MPTSEALLSIVGGAPMGLVKVLGSVSGVSSPGTLAVMSDGVPEQESVDEGMRPCDYCGHSVVIDSIDEYDCAVCGDRDEDQPDVAARDS